MITNLLVSIVVSLVTNVTEKFPEHMVQDFVPSDNGLSLALFHGHMESDKDPK